MYQKCQDVFAILVIFFRKELIMENIEEIARILRNQKAKEWRDNNKEKVKEINKRYWLKKAKQKIEKDCSLVQK